MRGMQSKTVRTVRRMSEWKSFLRRRRVPAREGGSQSGRFVGVADVFCSVGGLTLGVAEAIAAQGDSPRFTFAADLDEAALAVYLANFPEATGIPRSMDELVRIDRKSTRLNSSHIPLSRMPSSA